MRGFSKFACIASTCLLLVAAPALAADNIRESATDRRIAITFDDLPWASLDPDTALSAQASVPTRVVDKSAQLVRAISDADTPAIGFVNSARLLANGQPQAERMEMLEAWLDAGLDLGNHTASHVDLHAVGLQAYENDILACDRLLRPLLASRGLAPGWFRHPYLRTGLTVQDKAELGAMLAGHGYRVAPVTITTSDWIWAAAYARAVDGGDTATQAKLREKYVSHLLRMTSYFERKSVELLGHPVPQVLLLHANALNADTYVDFVERLRARGYRFVAIDEAMRDPAYRRGDEFTGALGTSWIHRWAIAAGKSWKFYGGEPTSPQWVVDLAAVPSTEKTAPGAGAGTGVSQ